MADTQGLLDLYTKLGYYSAGGGRPSLGEKIGGLLGALGQVGQNYGQGVAQYNQRQAQQQQLQNQQLQGQGLQQEYGPTANNGPSLYQQGQQADIALKRAQAGSVGGMEYFNTKTGERLPVGTTPPAPTDGSPNPWILDNREKNNERAFSRQMELLKNDQALDKQQKEKQMAMFNQGATIIAGARTNPALTQIENQRDAAIMGLNRLNEIQSKGKNLTPLDYVDILGQLWKAKTGGTIQPSELQEMSQPTGISTFNKYYTYLTGKTANATSSDIANNLKENLISTGLQADRTHEGYMKSAYAAINPALNPDSAEQLKKIIRGNSFSDATGVNAGSEYNPSSPNTSPQPTTNPPPSGGKDSPTANPAIGTVEVGDKGVRYRFKGGDRKNKNNWVKID